MVSYIREDEGRRTCVLFRTPEEYLCPSAPSKSSPAWREPAPLELWSCRSDLKQLQTLAIGHSAETISFHVGSSVFLVQFDQSAVRPADRPDPNINTIYVQQKILQKQIRHIRIKTFPQSEAKSCCCSQKTQIRNRFSQDVYHCSATTFCCLQDNLTKQPQ